MAQISESDIGKRVTIRLHDNPGYRDIVGHLISPSSLKNRHGEIVEFDPSQIFIWREIKDVARTATSGAPFSIRVNELERIANETWLAKEQEQIGNWLFRADVGITRRANSALVLGTGDQIEQMATQMISWYQHRQLIPTVSLVPELHRELDLELEQRGFEKLLDLDVMVKEHEKLDVDFDYLVDNKPDQIWMAVHGDQPIEALLKRSESKYLKIFDSGKLAAIGRTSFAKDWAVLSRIWVDENFRGKGYGRKILQALEAESDGRKLALQVSTTNSNAISLYKSAGYLLHHTGRFRALPQQIDPALDSLR